MTTPALLALVAMLLAPVAPATPVPRFQPKLAPKTKDQTARIRQLGTIKPLTPAQTLSTFAKISKDPVTTLGEPLTLSVRKPALDDDTFLMLLSPDWVVPVKEGNTPPHASFPSGDNAAFGGAFLFFGAAKGVQYLIDCSVATKGEITVALFIGDHGAVDETDHWETARPQAGHVYAVVPAQNKARRVLVNLSSSKKPWTMTTCVITPGT